MKGYRAGDPVVYRKAKVSPHPAARALDVYPSEHGDNYSYRVDKYWKVCEMPDPEHLVVLTRSGKRHVLDIGDPCLHRASFIERLLFRHRFPKLEG